MEISPEKFLSSLIREEKLANFRTFDVIDLISSRNLLGAVELSWRFSFNCYPFIYATF